MSESTKCPCGKDTHPLYGGRCEDCWALGNRCLIDNRPYNYRGCSGIGDDSDSAQISNQGPRSKRFIRKRR